MSTTFQQAIDTARIPLNDAAKVRYPDDMLLSFAIDAVREIAVYRPELFIITQNVPCTAGQAMQTVETANPIGLYVIDVQGVTGGNAVNKGDLDTLRRFRPGWRNDTAGPAENWFPITDDVTKRPQPKFYVYPKPPAGQQLIVQYVREPLPTIPVIGDVIPLDDQLTPAVSSYITFKAESIDDEHVLTQRAAGEYQRFAQIVGISEAKRKNIIIEGRAQ